jgi:hypothetical protein
MLPNGAKIQDEDPQKGYHPLKGLIGLVDFAENLAGMCLGFLLFPTLAQDTGVSLSNLVLFGEC